MIQREIMQNICTEELYNLSGKQSHKSSLMFIGGLTEKMTPWLGFKGCIDIDHEKTEVGISSRKNSNCQISQDGQKNVQY